MLAYGGGSSSSGVSFRQSESCCSVTRRLHKAAENPPNAEPRCLRAAEREGGLCASGRREEVEQRLQKEKCLKSLMLKLDC